MVLEMLKINALGISWEACGSLLESWQSCLGPLGGSWEHLGGHSWRLLEASWGNSGSHLGNLEGCWTLLGASWTALEAPLEPLGRVREPIGRQSAHLLLFVIPTVFLMTLWALAQPTC